MKLVTTVLCAALCAGITACGAKTEKAAPAAKPAVAVESAVAASTTISEGVEVTGSLEPKFAADVKTQIPGLIKQVYVTEWVRVKKGQPLARIDISETEAQVKRAEASVAAAQAGLAQARTAQTRAERELARVLKLKESGLATQQALDDTRTESEAAQARVEAARSQIAVAEEEQRQSRARLAKGLVSAPMDGVIALRDVNVGDLASDASSAKPIFRVVDNRLLNLTVTVPSTESARVKAGQPLEFTVDSLPGRTFSGRVKYINPELSSADRSLKVIAEFNNVPELLKGGLFAKGRIVTGQKRGVVLLPRPALATWDTAGQRATVYLLEGETARVRNVTTGAVQGDQVEIVSGIKPGETYVVRGGFNLKDGDRIQKGTAPAEPKK